MRGAQGHDRLDPGLERIAVAKRDMGLTTDVELLELSTSIRRRLSQGEDQARCIPEAFAAVAEAVRRSTGTVVTNSQLVAGASVLNGAVTELRDGEGKGIAAILAAYVSALAGMRVHIVTLDNYLARRDFLRARHVLEFLGVRTSFIGEARGKSTNAYAEVSYGSYIGFASDYLEDNLVAAAEGCVQDRNDFAIVDEADTILLDEARCHVQIVLDNTTEGERRRFVQHSQPDCRETYLADDQKILAECRVGNYFRAYRKLAGLTATATTAAARFKHFYGIDVVPVPASVPQSRVDRDDLWYVGTGRMLADLETRVLDRHGDGQPVLIKAGSSGLCQEISESLARRGVVHRVLHRDQDDADAAGVMAGAGKIGAVTILTEKAGRGYGIQLGGDLSYAAEEVLALQPYPEGADISAATACKLKDARNTIAVSLEAERTRVAAHGGLIVLGAFQSGSKRADDWVRGLAGRRGEPGESQFYHSSEEFSIKNTRLVRAETQRNSRPLICDGSARGRFFRGIFRDAYRNSEAAVFSYQRKMAEFDDLTDRQRREAYSLRRSILEGVGPDEIERWIISLAESQDIGILHGVLRGIYPVGVSEDQIRQAWRRERHQRRLPLALAEMIETDVRAAYQRRELELGPERIREFERSSALSTFDQVWSQHLTWLHDIYNQIPSDQKPIGKKIAVDLHSKMTASFEQAVKDIKKRVINGLFGM